MRNFTTVFGGKFFATVLLALLMLMVTIQRVPARERVPELPKPPTDRPEVRLDLSIEQAMQIALRNNLSISIERANVKISGANVQTAEGDFDATLFAGPSFRRTIIPISSALSFVGGGGVQTAIDEKNLDFNLGVRKRMSLGTDLSLEFKVNRLRSTQGFRNFRPQYTPTLDLNFTQPLLRRFGRQVTRNRIIVAKRNRSISAELFRQRVMDIVAQARDTYWDVVFARGDLEVRKQSLRLAQELVVINKAQVAVGTLAPIEILQAQARAAQREEEVIVGEKLVADITDRLRRVLNILDSPLVSGLVLRPTDEPQFVEMSIDLDQQIELALKNQPNLRQRRLDIENLRLNLKVRKNNLLPLVDLQASFGLNGLSGTAQRGRSPFEGDFQDSLDTLFSANFYQLRVGLNFEIPLGNRLARGEATRARLELARAGLELRDLEQETMRLVSEAVRRVSTSSKRVASTRIASKLAGEQLEAEQKRFSVGLSTSFNVLEFQEDLATARRNELNAIIDYNKAQTDLERITGVILAKHDIELDLK